MDDGGGNGTNSFRVKVRADAAKLTNVVIAGFGNRRNLVKCSSKMKPRLRAEWVVLSEEFKTSKTIWPKNRNGGTIL